MIQQTLNQPWHSNSRISISNTSIISNSMHQHEVTQPQRRYRRLITPPSGGKATLNIIIKKQRGTNLLPSNCFLILLAKKGRSIMNQMDEEGFCLGSRPIEGVLKNIACSWRDKARVFPTRSPLSLRRDYSKSQTLKIFSIVP